MDETQRKRMAYRGFGGTDPEDPERAISYTVQVSGRRAWLHREWDEEWENADGTGRDTSHECWEMSVDDLKKLMECANWTLQTSEAFEAAHPPESGS
jgi:hypothetical protein